MPGPRATRRSFTPAPARSGRRPLAKALGWFSIGLGLTELIAAERITRALGMEGKEGSSEPMESARLGHGVVSLSPDKHVGLWSRVAGDALDIVTLMTAMRHDNPKRDNVGVALAAVLGVTLLDIIGAQRGRGPPQPSSGGPAPTGTGQAFRRASRRRDAPPRDFQMPPDMRAAPALAAVSDRAPQERARPH